MALGWVAKKDSNMHRGERNRYSFSEAARKKTDRPDCGVCDSGMPTYAAAGRPKVNGEQVDLGTVDTPR